MIFQIENVLILGTVQGAVLALLGLGFSLVYGVGGILNLGHGAFYLITSYIFFITYRLLALDLLISIIFSLTISVIVGGIVYLALIKPLQDSHIGVVIVTFSFAVFMQEFVKVLAGIRPQYISPFISGSVEFLGITFPIQFVFVIFGSLILVLIVGLFISKTKIGKSIRAVSQDREAALLMGINADRILMITLMLSALLAGMAAVLYAPTYAITVDMGWSFLLSAFAVSVFGGMGSISGCILGGFIMGYAKTFCSVYISPALATLFPLIIIVIMLLFRPQGLLGKKEVY
jgi:branched-chain amino acid transport system permease protein